MRAINEEDKEHDEFNTVLLVRKYVQLIRLNFFMLFNVCGYYSIMAMTCAINCQTISYILF